MPQKVGKYDAEFRLAKPETIGETDHTFDLSNYVDFLESKIIQGSFLECAIELLYEYNETENSSIVSGTISALKRCRLTNVEPDTTASQPVNPECGAG